MNNMTATSVFSPVVATDEHLVHTHVEPRVPQKWSVVVRLAPGCGTTALLKVMSTLHFRHAEVSHMQYTASPGGGGVLTFECTTLVASIETVRLSIEKIVPVLSAVVHETH